MDSFIDKHYGTLKDLRNFLLTAKLSNITITSEKLEEILQVFDMMIKRITELEYHVRQNCE